MTLSEVIMGIQSLPPEDITKLRQILDAPTEQEQRIQAARALAREASLRDFSADRQWLRDHRAEYAGQWVALKDGRLIAHGAQAKAVFQAARQAAIHDALVVLVEPDDGRYFVNL